MDVTIEFDPKKTAFVLGPGINRLCLTTDISCDSQGDIPVDYKAVCEEGIKYAMVFMDPGKCSEKHRLLQKTCDSNPMYAAHAVTAILRSNGVYDSWLSFLHKKVNCLSGHKAYAKHYALQFLSAMNQKGALLATTCYAEVLEQVLGLKSVSLTENDMTSKVLENGGWPNSLLHIHGMFSQPKTVVFDFLDHNAKDLMSAEGKAVLNVFLQRNLFFVGFSDNDFDKTAEKFFELILPQMSQPGSMRPVFLSSVQNNNNPLLDNFLKVYYSDQMSLSLFHQILYASGTNTDEPNFLRRFFIDNISQTSSNSSSLTTSNFDTVLSLIIHEKDKPDTVIGNILSTIGRSCGIRAESTSYRSKVGQLRQVVLQFNTSGALKLSQFILSNQLSLVAWDVVAFQLEGGPLVWIQNRSQIAQYLTTTTKGEILANSSKNSHTVEDIPAAQPHSFLSSPPPLWPINPTSSRNKAPTTSEMTSSADIVQKKISLSGKLSPVTIPSSPISPDHQPSVSLLSSASVPAKYLSVVSGKLITGLPEELNPYHTIECYDQLTNKVVPMHASTIGCTASTNDTELNKSIYDVPVIGLSTSPLLSSSTVQAAVNAKISVMPQPEKNFPIQPITLTHKYQENNYLVHSKKQNDTSSPIGNRPHSNIPSSDNSAGEVNVMGISSNAKNVSVTTTPTGRPPLTTHDTTAAASLPAIPQPLPLPVMFHPTFTSTIPGTQLPFVYPSLTPFGISSPYSALPQFPVLPHSHLNHYTMVDYPTFPWPSHSKVAKSLQTPTLQGNPQTRKRCTPSPVVEGNSEVTSTIQEPSTPKKTRPDCFSTRINSHLALNSATLTSTTIPAATITRYNNIPVTCKEMDTSHKDDGSSSESEMNDSGDSDFEDDMDMVTYSKEPAPIEGTYNLPPFPNGRGVVQLWQFLLDMLLTPEKNFMIQWTGNEYEFTILQPDDIAAIWGEHKGKPRMNYDKLSRGLRYYYSKGIMDKIPGKKLTFKFTCNVEKYVRTRSRNPNAVQTLRAIIRNSRLNHDSPSDLLHNTPNAVH